MNNPAREAAEKIAAPTIGKVKPAVYHEIVAGIERAIANAYEDAACIAEHCTQDDAARDEPFRIAQTIRAHAAALPSAVPVEEQDALVDEVQRRMDQVVECAVEWHQAGREGAEWFEAAEKLGASIDSLLELRDKPVTPAECFCGTELEAGLCPNGHDPISIASPANAVAAVGPQPTIDDEARRLLTECCYTINALADQQAMPDDFYKRTLEAAGQFLERDYSKAATSGAREAARKAAEEIAKFVDNVQPLPFAAGLLEQDIAAILSRYFGEAKQ